MPYHLATPVYGGDGGDSNPARWFRCREIFHLTARSGSYIAVLSRLHIRRAFPPAVGAFHPFQRNPVRQSLFIVRRKTMKRSTKRRVERRTGLEPAALRLEV